MPTTLTAQIVDTLAEFMSPEIARRISNINATPTDQARLDELADRANRGTLTDEEKSEYDRALALINLVAMLQARARKILAN